MELLLICTERVSRICKLESSSLLMAGMWRREKSGEGGAREFFLKVEGVFRKFLKVFFQKYHKIENCYFLDLYYSRFKYMKVLLI